MYKTGFIPVRGTNRGMIKVTKVPFAPVFSLTGNFTEERLIARGMKVATIILL